MEKSPYLASTPVIWDPSYCECTVQKLPEYAGVSFSNKKADSIWIHKYSNAWSIGELKPACMNGRFRNQSLPVCTGILGY